VQDKKNRKKLKKAKIKQYRVKIKESEAVDDHLTPFTEWTTYSKNGLVAKLNFYKSSIMSQELHEWAFLLLKKNMKEIYEKVDYWSDTEKQAELKDNAARFIVVTNTTTSIPVAFVHFRFLIEMCNKLALYCYEIQLDSSVQRKGLGKHLMQLLEVIAKLHKYDWIILTVFKSNYIPY